VKGKSFLAFFVGVSSLVCALPSSAQFAKPEAAVEYRQSALYLMGNHFGRIKAQLDVSKPDVDAIRASAALIEVLKTLPFEAFLPGTEDIGDTAAKPEVWTDNERFKKLAHEMQDRVSELNAAAKSGDVKAIRASFADTGKACKSCHEDFRKKR
jgi:cytochrome c556